MNFKYILILIVSCFVCITSCDNETIDNPNGPTLESLVDGATQADLLLLASGVESVSRNDLGFYYIISAIVGREYNDLNGTDPRYTGELLGAGDGAGVLDNNGFLTTRSFSAGYRAIRNAQILSQAVDNTIASLSQEEINGYKAFAEVITAHELLKLLNKQYQNGVRTDVADADNLGAFVSYDEGLTNVAARLTNAASLLGSAGGGFNFNLSSGWGALGTPAGMAQFAHGLLARVELYRNNKAAALTALSNSFMDMGGALDMGVYQVFGAGGNDTRNPLFFVPGTDLFMAHNSFVADAEAGDTRLAKVNDIGAQTIDGLVGNYQVQIYSSDTEPFAMLRNEELILIAAEANIGSDNDAAVNAINIIRNSAGLGDYSGDTSDSALLDEVVNQRRYSLFGEGHRWVDMRRLGRLGDLPLDRPGDEVFAQFPTPVAEGN